MHSGKVCDIAYETIFSSQEYLQILQRREGIWNWARKIVVAEVEAFKGFHLPKSVWNPPCIDDGVWSLLRYSCSNFERWLIVTGISQSRRGLPEWRVFEKSPIIFSPLVSHFIQKPTFAAWIRMMIKVTASFEPSVALPKHIGARDCTPLLSSTLCKLYVELQFHW